MSAITIFLFSVLLISAQAINYEQLSMRINNARSTWKAEYTTDVTHYIPLLGTYLNGKSNLKRISYNETNIDIPTEFDSRKEWPECPSVGEVSDQSSCGSCWAFGAADSGTDRLCIASKGKIQKRLSAEDLLECCDDCGQLCSGGFPYQAWLYMTTSGIVTGGGYGDMNSCKAYIYPKCNHNKNGTYPPCGDISNPPKCNYKCQDTYPIPYSQDLYRFRAPYNLYTIEDIQKDILLYGPHEVSFTVYEDFLLYKQGIYQHIEGKSLGGHSVRLIGWGVENDVPYWTIANSWNEEWGENGFFRILRGKNECGIENSNVAGKAIAAQSHFNATDIANDDETINVYLIAHTHDDPGWIITGDEYYVKSVRSILDTAISALKKNKDRKFTYVEQAFFQRWWNEKDENVRNDVRELVRNGQLELNLGGWVMADEATTHYEDIINEMTLGSKFIYDEFGIRPTVAWHVDPFGHSSQVASLYSQMGFDTFTFWRIHYDDVENRKKTKNLEFIWRGSKSSGEESDIFTHYLESSYIAPNECDFFSRSIGEAYMDTDNKKWVQWDNSLPTFKSQLEEQGEDFARMVRERITWFDNGNNLLIPWGADFTFVNAEVPYENMDHFMDYINSNQDKYHIKLHYGVLSDYIKVVNQHKKQWSLKKGDFFPHADCSSGFWTGYYTSRDRLKGLVREKMNELSNAEMYLALSKAEKKSLNFAELYSDIMKLRKAQGEVQHHDAITGTETQHSADDYNVQLIDGAYFSNKAVSKVLDIYTTLENINKNSTEVFPLLTEENRIAVVLSNSIAWNRKEVIQLISPRSDVGIYDKEGKPFEVQINEIPEFSYDRRNGTYYVYFPIEIPAMGYTTVYIKVNKDAIVTKPVQDTFISNNKMKLNTENGYIKSMTNSEGETIPLNTNLYHYKSALNQPRSSGAYIFVPAISGAMGIGGSNSKDKEGTYQTEFSTKVEDPAYLISNAGADSWDDSFITILKNREADNIKFYTRRTDGSNPHDWMQGLGAALARIDMKKEEEGIEKGFINIGESNEEKKYINIVFKQPFPEGSTVHLYTTITSNINIPLTCSVVSITNTGATVRISIFGDNRWSGENTLTYIAFLDTVNPFTDIKDKHLFGVVEGVTDKNGWVKLPVTFTESMNNARVLVQVYTDAAMSIVTSAVTEKGFKVNCRTYQNEEENIHFTIIYYAYESHVIADYVVPETTPLTTTVLKGPLVEEIQQIYRQGYYSVYRLYKQGLQEDIIEVNTEMNGVDDGREVVLQLNTNLKNEKTIYADTNGMEQQKRVFNTEFTQPIAGNFYPVVSRAYIEDEKEDSRLTVLVDRAHGISSLENGRIEIMIKRRTLGDDGYGVGTPLTENDHVKEKIWFFINKKQDSSILYKQLDLYFAHPPMSFYSTLNKDSTINNNSLEYSSLTKEFPKNLQLLNFQLVGLKDKTYLLRLHHIYEKDENKLAIPVEIDLATIFKGFKILDYEEKILTGMFNKEQVEKERMRWETEPEKYSISKENSPIRSQIRGGKSTVIVIQPMEFKTFAVTLE
ncbi:hypothetical protein WA158_006227 [Blastocystis sp. Blastoise]